MSTIKKQSSQENNKSDNITTIVPTKKISVITICYNEPNLEKTCESIINQTWQNFEWIVVDGGSNDQTQEIWNKYKHRIDTFISEPDNGIYNAMNKGLKLARGEFVLFMNAGDYFYNDNVLKRVIPYLDATKADIFYGDAQFILADKSIRYKCLPSELNIQFFVHDCINHQSSYIKRELFEKYGYYDEQYKIVSDWEKWIVFYQNKAKYFHLPFLCSIHNYCGISAKATELTKKERLDVIKKYNLDIDTAYDYKTFFTVPASLNPKEKAEKPQLIVKNTSNIKDITISVVVPVYNVSKYIESCINSILAQKLKNIEIICINDFSTDDSLEKLKNLAKTDNRISVYTFAKNEGVANARNWGIELAKGKYISFVDSDDNIDKAFLSTLYRTAQKNDNDVVKGAMEIHCRNGAIAQNIMNENIRNLIKKQSFIGIAWNHEFSTAIYKKSFLTKNKICFPLLTNGEDIIFILRTLINKPSLALEDKASYFYIQRSDSASFATNFSTFLNLIKFYEEQLDILQRISLSEKEYQTFCQKNIISSITEYLGYLMRNSTLCKEEILILKQKINLILDKVGNLEELLYPHTNFYIENHNSLRGYISAAKKILDNNGTEGGQAIPVPNNKIEITFKLFNFLPFYKYKKVGGREQWKVFGVPIFKIRQMTDRIATKYYILGMPVLKVIKKII